ncbi:hypothetical protein [Pyrococcus kukulkanii]|uniref:hypothetical protein n=1 Tax=Pyrococcus kukulkanii TaxID=1609559 RepID=UPI00356A6BD5
MEVVGLFSDKKNVRVVKFRGHRALIYMKHDDYFGAGYIPDLNFFIPNMPKLQYAIGYSVDFEGERLIIHNRLSKKAEPFEGRNVRAFYKLDGFNLLAYEFDGDVIYKTRKNPEAGKNIRKVIDDEAFPRENIEEMVRAGYIPVMEVWGPKLREFNIMYGGTDVEKLAEVLGLEGDLFVHVIAVREFDNERFHPFLHPRDAMHVAKFFGLDFAPVYSVIRMRSDEVIRVMAELEEENQRFGRAVYEGVVIHAGAGVMLKVKPFSVMFRDVLAGERPTRSRILREASKALLERDFLTAGREFEGVVEEVLSYLAEDYKITREIVKSVREVVAEYIADGLVREGFTDPRGLGIEGVHGKVIGYVVRRARQYSQGEAVASVQE